MSYFLDGRITADELPLIQGQMLYSKVGEATVPIIIHGHKDGIVYYTLYDKNGNRIKTGGDRLPIDIIIETLNSYYNLDMLIPFQCDLGEKD